MQEIFLQGCGKVFFSLWKGRLNNLKRTVKLINMLSLALLVTVISFVDSAMITHASEGTITDRKWVTNQTSSHYNDGKYKGTLTRYFSHNDTTPKEKKNIELW